MSKEKRKYPREPMDTEAVIRHESIGEQNVIVKDASEGGFYIVSTTCNLPPVGSMVQVIVKNPGGGELQSCQMRIVRVDSDGCGIGLIPCES
ncbi:MAG: PilZ domain-containing protein [Pseudomonadota bacterium]